MTSRMTLSGYIDEFAVFVSFGNNVDIGLYYDNNPFWISADTNTDDLERPIHLKVRLRGRHA